MNSHEMLKQIDAWIDDTSSSVYIMQPAAQDWARVAKIAEEAGEAVAALIGLTGQNPRKGFSHSAEDLNKELLDVAVTALAAYQHFNKQSYPLADLENHITSLWDRAVNAHR